MINPVRVLHIVTKMDRAGLETMLMNYYRHIDKDRLQFDFLTHRREKGDFDDEILCMGGRIFNTYPIAPSCFVKYLSDLDCFFREHTEYRIVHSHIDSLSTFSLMAAKKAGVPVRISHSHNTNFDKDCKLPLRHFSKRLILGAATQFWGCSKAAVRFMFGKRVYLSENYTVLNNAIDIRKFAFNPKARVAVQKKYELEGKFVVGHIGRFVHQKNHEFLIDIFEKIYEKDKSAVLLLVGDGVNKAAVQKKTERLGLVENVRFLGVRHDIPDILQAFDVFMLPSRFEGLGIVLIEAQAAGIPAIASDTVPEEAAVTDLVSFLSLKESAVAWAEAALSQKGKPRRDTSDILAQSGYDIECAAMDLEKHYLTHPQA